VGKAEKVAFKDMGPSLLTREEFRAGVFARDSGLCVLCGETGVDAHHIMDRKLFPDGGYYLDNGVTLCGECHLQAETAPEPEFLPSSIREKAGIASVVLPPQLEQGQEYDKWGRVADAGLIKYPHTPHLPWSPGYDAEEDMILEPEALDDWYGRHVVITEKMDGEGTTLYRNAYHARSTTYTGHPSRTRGRAIWGGIRHDIPEGWRVCAENVSAVHSIRYGSLPGYLMVFSVWEGMRAFSWEETEEWAGLLGLPTVPVLWRGQWLGPEKCHEVIAGLDLERQEGIVVRPAGAFRFGQIQDTRGGVLGKWVRRGHVTTDEHWMDRPVEWNGLRGDV
jgi:hypothetical protein